MVFCQPKKRGIKQISSDKKTEGWIGERPHFPFLKSVILIRLRFNLFASWFCKSCSLLGWVGMIKVGNSSIFKWECGVLRLKLLDEITQNFALSSTMEHTQMVLLKTTSSGPKWSVVKTWVACQWQFTSHLAGKRQQVKRQFGEI